MAQGFPSFLVEDHDPQSLGESSSVDVIIAITISRRTSEAIPFIF